MTCVRARRLVAAYRRDEWSPTELERFGQHLAGCAACRRVEAHYRDVGESVRQLPSITPPPSLRANVFAAIAAEEARKTSSLVAMTRDETQPRLVAVRSVATGGSSRRPLVLGTPAAIAVAALLLVGLVTARFLPALAHGGLSSLAASLSGAAPASLSNAPLLLINQYAVAPSAGHVQAALASGAWVAYVATTANGDSMLYVTSRSSRHTLALLPAPQSTRITLRGMSDQWVIWQSGANLAAGPWTLLAS
ncbi:MAG TPA: zf-HC2 domain-containing protein, partial [Ktedonobacterales bacterium]|nr:zf-HC2 domain-containing protein [Ktedonobacterales bacterium]